MAHLRSSKCSGPTGLAVLASLAAAAAIAAPQAAPAVITNSDWESRPAVEDLLQVFPADPAAAAGGRVRLSCKIAGDGGLTRCEVASESPEKAGFGEAALKLAPLFRMKAVTRDGEPVGGASVSIPIQFSLD